MILIDERVLAVDWGSRRIGLAVSDPTRTIARPLGVIGHVSRVIDAQAVIEIAESHQVQLIIVGVTYDENHGLSPIGRRCSRFADQVRMLTDIPVVLWDEDLSTAKAKQSAVDINIPRKKRMGHRDAAASAHILQDYLDRQKNVK